MAIHFISGLPRSGSTLLAAVVRQNPRFTAGMSSALGGIVTAALRAIGSESEFAAQIDDARRRRILQGLFDSYYGGPDSAEVVIDTNRMWTAQLPLLKALHPDAKIIACVRNPAWIMDSIERLVRSNALEHSKMFNNQAERATVYSRSDALIGRDRLIGYAWSALKEAYYGDEADRLLIVEYDLLCQRPAETLRLIYQFIGEDEFEHDFDHVEYEADEFDQRLGTPGLHTVKRKVQWQPRRTVLPPDIFDRFAQLSFWRDGRGTKARRIVQAEPAAPRPSDHGHEASADATRAAVADLQPGRLLGPVA